MKKATLTFESEEGRKITWHIEDAGESYQIQSDEISNVSLIETGVILGLFARIKTMLIHSIREYESKKTKEEIRNSPEIWKAMQSTAPVDEKHGKEN